MALLLEILLDFALKNEQWFCSLQESVISLMLKLCDTSVIEEAFCPKVKKLWADISVFIFKTPSYHQLIENVFYERKGLWVFIEDEATMNEIFETINNRSGSGLTLAIFEWNMNHASKQINYDGFCSKYFKTI